MRFNKLLAVSTFAFATSAFAHGGVQNPAVKARMDGMVAISKNMKTIATMAKGQTAFDAATIQDALSVIEAEAGQIPALFEAKETDAKSEALDLIWTDWDNFAASAEVLRTTVMDLPDTITTPEDAGATLAKLGKTCKSCHSKYRE
ncbi:c-type cytochrome [Actibacterium lipolyticum]|uniref:Cytochrome c-556 n=1 Tax=Actibacterium lipolyticum TaxID=1524263 RepID=A0A238KF25_9RHOB|nr:cytochrome c [Actibacterium lipolyticum]SMX41435.1 Cytochrome c-556 [Actibacterium lipolyticum]